MSASNDGLNSRFRLRAVATLIALYVAIWFGWLWPWGLLFLAITIPTIRAGETELIDRVERTKNPVLFWLIVATWLVVSIWLIAADVAQLAGVTL